MSDGLHLTRRTVLRTGGAVAGGSALAGCITGEDNGNGGNGNGNGNGDEIDGPYSVTMEPVGEVEFDSVPQSWAVNNGTWGDMGIALGQDPPEAIYLNTRIHTQHYEEIPDLSVDREEIGQLWNDELTSEEFMELSNSVDLFVMDPEFIMGRLDHWSQEDIDTIEATGTPFFGSSIFSRGYEWHDYDYLTLYEAFEKLSQVFQEEDRYEAFAELHDEFQSDLEDIVPPEGERPSVAIMWPQPAEAPESFSPYLIDKGTSFKQWRDLGVEDALATTDVEDFHAGRTEVDYELLLDIDPDVLLIRGNEHKSAEEFQNTVVSHMKSHNVASQLTAVQEGDVYRGGPLHQGPIVNLAVTERAAQQLYDVDEELFDRQEVSNIVNGDF
ncbi:ABC transporter substrate-binding protein [Natrinema sp. SYSU A 869]|uniref:ABC transporter substrate-binding protein n=1 Tax=Natrinema sp. SYSU A 869 TaxID=2871694 RepID=UPI001CA466A0|nr:ABC transporter substrate-binding protein [Natrinema sp. SYSU A 869]